MKIQRLTKLALLMSLTVVFGYLLKFPTLTGYVTLADVGIFTTALLFGKKEGAIVGGGAAFVIDILSGTPQWCLISLVAHGLQGYIAGCGMKGNKKVFVGLGALAMLIIYFIAESLMFNIGSGIASLLGNVLQEVVGMVGCLIVYATVSQVQRNTERG